MQTRINWSFWKGGSEEGVGWSTTEPEPEGGKRQKHAGHRVRERTPPWLEVSGLVGSLFFSATQEERHRRHRLWGLGKRRMEGSCLGKVAESQGLREQLARAVHSASHWLHTAILVNQK